MRKTWRGVWKSWHYRHDQALPSDLCHLFPPTHLVSRLRKYGVRAETLLVPGFWFMEGSARVTFWQHNSILRRARLIFTPPQIPNYFTTVREQLFLRSWLLEITCVIFSNIWIPVHTKCVSKEAERVEIKCLLNDWEIIKDTFPFDLSLT